MATTYNGNSSGVQSPSVAPGPGIIQAVSVPAGTDALSIESITQWAKVNADYEAFSAFPGLVDQFRERWDIAAQTIAAASAGVITDLAKRWSFTVAAGTTQSVQFKNPASGYPGRTVTLNQGTGNASQASALATSFPVWMPQSTAYRCLIEFDVQATTSTLNSREWRFGLSTDQVGTSVSVGFENNYTQANWQAYNGITDTDTGVPVSVAGSWVRFSVLIDTVAGTPAMTYKINGTTVATLTTGLPTAGSGPYYLISGGRQVTSGVCSFSVGNVVATWTKF